MTGVAHHPFHVEGVVVVVDPGGEGGGHAVSFEAGATALPGVGRVAADAEVRGELAAMGRHPLSLQIVITGDGDGELRVEQRVAHGVRHHGAHVGRPDVVSRPVAGVAVERALEHAVDRLAVIEDLGGPGESVEVQGGQVTGEGPGRGQDALHALGGEDRVEVEVGRGQRIGGDRDHRRGGEGHSRRRVGVTDSALRAHGHPRGHGPGHGPFAPELPVPVRLVGRVVEAVQQPRVEGGQVDEPRHARVGAGDQCLSEHQSDQGVGRSGQVPVDHVPLQHGLASGLTLHQQGRGGRVGLGSLLRGSGDDEQQHRERRETALIHGSDK